MSHKNRKEDVTSITNAKNVQYLGIYVATATVTHAHKSLCNVEKNVDSVETVADVFPVCCEDHHRLSVSPRQVIVVITFGRQNKRTKSFLNTTCGVN